MSPKTVTVRNFLRELRGTGSLSECHSKHPPTSRSPWRGHRQWDFSILLTKFFLSPIPSSSETLQSVIYWNTCGLSARGAQNLWCWGVPAAESCHTWLPNISALEAMGVHGPFCSMGPRCQAALLSVMAFLHSRHRKPQICSLESSPKWQKEALQCAWQFFQSSSWLQCSELPVWALPDRNSGTTRSINTISCSHCFS